MRIQIKGAEGAVQQAAEALRRAFPEAEAQRQQDDDGHRGVDPVAVIALILSLPSAVESTLTLLEKRQKAREEREAREKALAQLRADYPDVEIIAVDDPRNDS